jgi:protoheme IX farnesyltransferase
MFGYAGVAYAVTAIASSALMIALALRLRAAGDGTSSEQAARHLFAFSVLYLFLLFAVLLVEQGIGLPSHALFR